MKRRVLFSNPENTIPASQVVDGIPLGVENNAEKRLACVQLPMRMNEGDSVPFGLMDNYHRIEHRFDTFGLLMSFVEKHGYKVYAFSTEREVAAWLWGFVGSNSYM